MKKLITFVLSLSITIILVAPSLSEDIYENNSELMMYCYNKDMFLNNIDTMEFTVENLYIAMVYMDIKNPETLVKQAILESGNFSSKLWTSHNNLFGMTHSITRNSTSLCPVLEFGFASYSSWADAVRDMKHFQEYWESKGWDLSEYEYFIVNLPYATDTEYLAKLDKIIITL